MLYYRNKSFLKKHLMITLKGMAVIGVAAWLGAYCISAAETLQDEPCIVLYEMPAGPPEFAEAVVPEEEQVTFIEPAVGVITSPYGERWGRNHNGIDIGGEHGSDILAADKGTVKFSGWVNGYGNYIIIDHGNGYETAYAHCSELLVEEGDTVEKGQDIALMGSTGNSTGPHLHFEIKSGGEYLNPLEFVIY